MRDRDRVYAEMLDPGEGPPSRAVLRIAEVNDSGTITSIEVVDPGQGYEFDPEQDSNLTLSLISQSGPIPALL